MTTCSNCGRTYAQDRAFCECGAYLSWDIATGMLAATTPPTTSTHTVTPPGATTTAARVPAPPPAADTIAHQAPPGAATPPAPTTPLRERALITLRAPGDRPGPAGRDLEIAIVPGERASVHARVRNQSDIVDGYELVVEGLPREWWSVPAGTAYLMPLGAGGEYEQDVEIVLHPPRTPAAAARRWDVHVAVRSRASGSELARTPLSLTMLPFAQVSVGVSPQRATRRLLPATYDIAVANEANGPVRVALDADDREDACRVRLHPATVELAPGEHANVHMRVRMRRPVWAGGPVEHQVAVVAVASGSGPAAPPRTAHATLRQRSLVPGWLAVAAPAALVLGFVLFKASPKQVAVPAIRNQDPVTLTRVEDGGLKLEPCRPKASNHKPGTVLEDEQSPAAGSKVAPGTTIHCAVAVAPGTTRVPMGIIGAGPRTAQQMLAKAGLTVGPLTPNPPASDAVVTNTVPAPGEPAKHDAPVPLYFSPVPPPAPENTVVVSDDNSALHIASAVDGKPLSPLSPSKHSQTNPAFTADGRIGVFIRDTQLALLLADGTSAGLRPVAEKYDYPSFPRPQLDGVQRSVLAVVLTSSKPVKGCDPAATKRCTPSDSDLCLGRVRGRTFKPSCIVNRGYAVSRPHWSPDGKQIFAGARTARGFTVVTYRSNVAFSAKAENWHLAGASPPSFATFVKELAVSPDGKRAAAVVRTRRGYRLVVTSMAKLDLKHARRLPIEACKVEWIDESWLAVVKLGPTCNRDTGDIVRIAPAAGLTETPLVGDGDNPAFRRVGG